MSPTAAPSQPTRRTVLAGALAATGTLTAASLTTRSAHATTTTSTRRLPFDPPGTHRWRTGSYPYVLRGVSPYAMGLKGPYPLTQGLATGNADGAVLSGGLVRARVGGRFVPQATTTCWWLMPQVESYRLDRDPKRLAVIAATVRNMYSLGVRDAATGGTLMPHTVTYHGGTVGQSMPWYSGMSQGMALSVASQLYYATGDPQWLTMADALYRSYRHYRSATADNRGAWFVSYERAADGSLHTFFEEYPSTLGAHNAHVVNGFIYAIWGLYDYYRVTRLPEARVLLDRAVGTLEASFSRYRVAGGPSWYAMTPWGHTYWGRPTSYHYGVARILQRTALVCGGGVLHRQGTLLLADHTPHA